MTPEERYCRAVFEAWKPGGNPESRSYLGVGRYRSIREWLYGMIWDAEEEGKGAIPKKPWTLICMAIAAMDRDWEENGDSPEGWDFEENHPTGKLRREDAFPHPENAKAAYELQRAHRENVRQYGERYPDPWRKEMQRLAVKHGRETASFARTSVLESKACDSPKDTENTISKRNSSQSVPYLGETQRWAA